MNELKLSDVQFGDILLFKGDSLFSELIKQGTKSPYSHVALTFQTGILPWLVFESIETIGVRTIPIAGYRAQEITVARHLNANQMRHSDLAQYATSKLGDAYDSEDITRIVERILDHGAGEPIGIAPDATTFICSEYVYACYRAAGLNLSGSVEGYIAPADIAEDANIKILGILKL